jgi:prepilin-type N-terminal cleavage/methylation domain-containing protein
MSKSFTLIEILVVIVVIGVLSAFILVGMSSITSSANIAKSKAFLNSMDNALLLSRVSQWKLDEVSGTTANDSWLVNTGTLTSFTDTTAGYGDTHTSGWMTSYNCTSGTCLKFDGVDDYVNINANDSLNNQNFTISFWANASSIEAGTSGIIGTSGYTSNLGTGIYSNANNLYNFWSYNGSAPQYVFSIFTITTGWNYYVVTKSGVNFNCYKNGVNVITDNTTLTNNINYTGVSWRIGQSIGSAYNFLGSIDDVRIYNAAIPTSVVGQNYYSGLNKLFKNNEISLNEFNQKIVELKTNLVIHE